MQDVTVPEREVSGTQTIPSTPEQTSTNFASLDSMSVSNTDAPTAPASNSPEPSKGPSFQGFKRLMLRIGVPIIALALITGGAFALEGYRGSQEDQRSAAQQFDNIELPLSELVDQEGLGFTGIRSLVINGTLRANEGIIVAPTTLPTGSAEGQIYYDQDRNELGYYNGSQFVYLGDSEETGVTSLGGAAGNITLGGNLQLVNGRLTVVQEVDIADGDSVTGNELTNVVTNSGLVRVGDGTTIDPFQVGLITCADGQIIKSTGGGSWGCGNDIDTDTDTDTTYSAGTGITFNGTQINNSGVVSFNLPTGSGLANDGDSQNVSLKLQDCANFEVLQYGASGWDCAGLAGGTSGFTITDGTNSEAVASGNTVTFVGNEGLVAVVSTTDTVTYGITDGGVTTIKLADGSVTTDKILDGTVTTIDLADGSVDSGKILDGSIANSDLTNDDITINAGTGIAGGGIIPLGGSTNLALQPCASGQILKNNGTDYLCAADEIGQDNQSLSITSTPGAGNTIGYDLSIDRGNTVSFSDRDTLYTAVTGGGLALNAEAFSLQSCTSGQILKSNGSSYVCATDADTLYMGGTGISLDGITNTFNIDIGAGLSTDASDNLINTGVLNIVADSTGGNSNSPIALGGTVQNPTVGFANGAAVGQIWLWNGTEWELTTLPDSSLEGDGIIGNEVVGGTGVNSGLIRSGAGTSIDPYTLAVSVGTGLSINASNQITNNGVISFNLGTSTALVSTGTASDPIVDIKPCADGDVLRYNTTSSTWDCVDISGIASYSFSISDGVASQSIANTETVTFIGNQGLAATVSPTDSVTLGLIDGGVTTVKLADGSVTTPKLGDGSVTTIKVVDGTVTNIKLANSSLSVNAGIGLAGGGVVSLGSSTTLSLQACADGQILEYDGTTSSYLCGEDDIGMPDGDDQTLSITSTPGAGNTVGYTLSISEGNSVAFDDRDTLYTAATTGGLALNAQAFSLTSCPTGQVLRSTGIGTYGCSDAAVTDTNTTYAAGSGLNLAAGTFSINSPTCAGTDKLTWDGTAFICSPDVDTDTTYSAGTGIDVTGTTISNTGVLTLSAATTGGNVNIPLAIGGTAQNPDIGFADGAIAGQFWQWNGTEWELAVLPAGGPETDGVIGNEVIGATGTSNGLTRSGAGTSVSPYTLAVNVGSGLSIDGSNQIVNNGVLSFGIGASTALTNVGTGQNPIVDLKACADGEVLRYNTTTSAWDCVNLAGATSYSFSITDGTTSQTINDSATITFIGNQGLAATVSATNNVTYGIVDGGVTTIKLNDGSVTSTKIADGTVTNIDLANGTVTNAKLANSSLSVNAGIGLAGGGVVSLGSATTLSLKACSDGEILRYDGGTSDYVCAADQAGSDSQTLSITANAPDVQNTIGYDLSISGGNTVQFNDRDTLYTALTGGGLALGNGAFSLQTCAVGQLLKSTNGATPAYSCANDIDTDTTYTAGTGISFNGTQINNTGVLSVSAANTGGNLNTPIVIGGTAESPNVGFSNGSAIGDFWQWNGTEWALAQLPVDAEGDDVIGNEVTGVTGTASGLVRSGTGTAVDPYTLAVSIGAGLAINGSNQVVNTGVLSFNLGASTALANSGTSQNPTIDLKACADGEVLRYNGTTSVWECVSLSGATSFAFDISDGTTSQTINDTNTISFIGNEGLVAAVSVTDQVTYGIASGGVTTIKVADGAIVTAKLSDGAVVTAKLADGAVNSAKVTDGSLANADLANSSLTVTAGDGLSGGGLVALGAATTLNLQPCTADQILKYNGTSTNWECAADNGGDGTGTDSQTLSITNAPGGGNTITYDLTISSGNTVQFNDRDTLYTAATNGGLALNAGAFSLMACTDGQIVKYNGVSSAWECAPDDGGGGSTTYDAGTGLSLSGTTFNVNVGTGLGVDVGNNLINNGVLAVGGTGAVASTGGQNPNLSLNTSANLTQTGASLDLSDSGAAAGTYGNTGVNVAQLTVDAKGRITTVSNRTLPNASASVTGVLSSTDFATFAAKENALTFNSGLTRTGNTVSTDLADSGTSATSSSVSGLEIAGGGLSIIRGCSNNQVLKWNSTTSVWACAADIDTDTDAQTLSFNDGTNVLTISGGNSVTITDDDTTYTNGTGLTLTSNTFAVSGLTATPCAANEKITWNGTAFVCALDDTGAVNTYTAGAGIAIDGSNVISNTGVISFNISDGTIPQTIDNAETVTFLDGDGLTATVSATNNVTYGITDGGVTTVKIADGNITTIKLAGASVSTAKIQGGAVTNIKLANDSLSVNPGDGLSGGGLVALGSATTLSLQACIDGQILKYDGVTGWECQPDNGGTDDQTLSFNNGTRQLTIENGNTVTIPDNDTLYTAATNGGLALNAQAFSLTSCPVGQVLRSTGVGTYGCSDAAVTDTNTTYTAGSGLSLAGNIFSINSPTCVGTDKLTWNGTAFVCAADVDTNTTYTAGTGIDITAGAISNTGVLTATAATTGGNVNQPIALGGTAQNPTFGFSNGATAGDFWQWNGTAWALAQLPVDAEGDDVIGNEVTGVTGASNGLTRSGAGTVGSPYTLAANVGAGLSINGSNQIINTGVISFSISDGVTSQAIDNAETISFLDGDGLTATVTATNNVTYGIANSGVTTVKIANGDVTNNKLANDSLTVTAGDGLAGGGLVALGASTTLSLQACADGEILRYDTVSGWICSVDTAGTDSQTLSFNDATDQLTITGGNTVTIPDTNTLYSALTAGGLTLSGTAFSLQTCAVGQVLKSTNGTTPTYTCANDIDTDTNTTYSAGTGLSLTGTTFANTGVLSVAGGGAIASSGGQNPAISLTTSTNFTQTGSSLDLSNSGASAGTYGNSGVTVANITVDAKGRITSVSNRTLPTATASVNGILTSANFATFAAKENALTFNAPISRSGNTISFNLTASGTTATANSSSGLEIAGGGLSIIRGCSGNQVLKWNGAAWACGNDIDTDSDAQTLSFNNGTRVLTISGGNNVTIPDANNTYTAGTGLQLSGSTFSIDTNGALNGNVLTYNAGGLSWQAPAAPSCTTGTGGTYFCQNGNTFGGTATLGTNDAFGLQFETNNQVRLTIDAGGEIGLGVTAPSERLHLDGRIRFVSSETAYDGDAMLFIGQGPDTAADGSLNAAMLTAIDAHGNSGDGIVMQYGGTADGGGLKLTDDGIVFWGSADDDLLRAIDEDSNSVRFVIDDSGDVGIGTGGPAYDLEVVGTNASVVVHNSGNSRGGISALTSGRFAILTTTSADDIVFGYSPDVDQPDFSAAFVERLRLDNGNGSLELSTAGGGVFRAGDMTFVGGGNYAGISLNGAFSQENYNLLSGINDTNLYLNRPTNSTISFRENNSFTQMTIGRYSPGGFPVVEMFSDLVVHGALGLGDIHQLIGNQVNVYDIYTGVNEIAYNFNGRDNADYVWFNGAGTARFRMVTDNGNLIIDGDIDTFGAPDVAENIDVTDHSIEAGDIVAAAPSGSGDNIYNESRARKTSQPYDAATLGVISTDPGLLLNSNKIDTGEDSVGNQRALAIAGRVPVKVNTENGPIKAGDMITASSVPGVGMKATEAGRVVGVALDDYNGSGTGKIVVFINPHTWFPTATLDSLKQATWDGGIVTKDTTFMADVLFEGPVTFNGKATFAGNVDITGKVKLSGDQVNEATLLAGEERIEIEFGGRYQSDPYVTATPREFLDGRYRITDVDDMGFAIEVSNPQAKDVRFDWHSFMKN